MKKTFFWNSKRTGVLFAALSLLLCGCADAAPAPPPPVRQVVTEVDVVCLGDAGRLTRHYTDPEKMEKVLNCLRLAASRELTEEPKQAPSGSSFRIILTLSDGSRVRYRQKKDFLLQKEDGPWQRIDPEQAAGLERLLEKTPGDDKR